MNASPLRSTDAAGLATLAAMSGASFLVLQCFAGGFGVVALTVVKGAVAAGFLAPWLRAPQRRAALARHGGALLVLSLLGSTLPFGLSAFAAPRVGAGTLAVLHATAPLMAALVGAVWLGERPARRPLAGMAVGLAGVALLSGERLAEPPAPDGGGAADGIALALFAALAAALCSAVGTQFTRHRLGGLDPVVLAIATQGGSALTLLLPALWLWPEVDPGAAAWASVVSLGCIGSGLGFVLHYRLVQRIGAPRTMTVTLLAPVAAMLLEAGMFGRTPGWVGLLGGLLVCAGTAAALGVWAGARTAVRSLAASVRTDEQPLATSRPGLHGPRRHA